MRRMLSLMVVVVFVSTSACSGASGGCNDDYNPADHDSCSYNPVYAGLVRERGANVGENWVRTDSGSSGLYLIVDPPEVKRGSPVKMSVLNTFDVDLELGPSFRVEGYGRLNNGIVRNCSLGASMMAPAGEESEVFDMMGCRGDAGEPFPAGRYIVNLGVTADGDEVPGGLGAGFRIAP